MSVPGGNTTNSFPKSNPRVEKHLGGEETQINLNFPQLWNSLLSAPDLTAYPDDLQDVLDFYPEGRLHSFEPDSEARQLQEGSVS